jgi:MFS family permease
MPAATGSVPIGQGAQPGSGRLKYGRTFILGVVNGVLFNLAEALIGGTTVLPIFISNVTSSKILVGLSGTMGNAGWFMPQLIVANLIQHVNRKKPVYVWAGVVRIVAIWTIAMLVGLLAGARAGLFLVIFFVLYSVYCLAGGVAGIPFMDIVAKAVPSRRRGTFFGARLFFGGVVSALAGIFVRNVLAAQTFPDNFATLFIAASVVITLAIISFSLVKEPEANLKERRMPFKRFLLRGPFLLKNVKSYRMLLVVRIMLGVWGMALPFYILYAREHLGLPATAVGIFLSIQMVGMIISNLLWGALSNRMGNKVVLELVSAVAILSPLLTLLTNVCSPLRGTACFGIVFFFIGFALSGIRLGYTNYMLDVSPDAERPTYLGFMNTFLAPVLLLSSVGGLVVQKTSYEMLFAIVIAAGVASVVFALQLEEPRSRAAGDGEETVTAGSPTA